MTWDFFCTTANGELSTTVSGGTAPYSYSWFGGSSVSFLSNYSNLLPGVYSVIVTDANGCSTTTSVTLDIPSCSCLIDFTISSTTANTATGLLAVFTPIGGTNTYNGNHFKISNGTTFTIDPITTGTHKITFNNCSFYLGTDAKIIVLNGGNVEFVNTTTIQGCGNMWLYTKVQSGGTIKMDKSTYRDALNGIILNDGCYYTISANIFDFNRYSIKAYNGEFKFQGVIYDNTFRCSGNLYSGDANTTSHIYLENAANFKIGTTNTAGTAFAGNTIKQALNGIEAVSSSSVFAYQNSIESNLKHGITANHSQVYAYDNTIKLNPNHGVTITNYSSFSAANDNDFNDNGWAIWATFQSSLNVLGNDFDHNAHDIYSRYCTNQPITIQDNDFTNTTVFCMAHNFNYPSKINIANNNITGAANIMTYGIGITDGVISPGSVIEIQGNNLANCKQGIIMSNTHSALIHGNTITIPSPGSVIRRGMYLAATERCTYKYNNVFGNAYTDHTSTGIYQANGGKNAVQCNNVYNLGRGVDYEGYANLCVFAGNLMQNCNNHLYIGNNPAGLGSQGRPVSTLDPDGFPFDNEWTGTAGNSQTYTNFANAVSTNTIFYARPGSPTEPTLNLYNNAASGTAPVTVTTLSSYTGDPYCDAIPALVPDKDNLIRIANDSIDFGDAEAIGYMYKQNMYLQLKEDTALANSSAYFTYARDSLDGTIIGNFKFVNDSIAKYVNDTTISDSVKILRAQAVAVLNDTLVVAKTIDENTKFVNAIYLATVARNIDTLTNGQVAQLRSVAEQCPFEGGNAVYLARDLLVLVDTVYADYDSDCADRSRFATGHIESFKKAIKNDISIYPNPTKGLINITGKIVKGKIILSDIAGRIVLTQTINTINSFASLDISVLKDGVYFYSIYSGADIRKQDRLIIIK